MSEVKTKVSPLVYTQPALETICFQRRDYWVITLIFAFIFSFFNKDKLLDKPCDLEPLWLFDRLFLITVLRSDVAVFPDQSNKVSKTKPIWIIWEF